MREAKRTPNRDSEGLQEGTREPRSAASWRRKHPVEKPWALFQTVSEGQFSELRVTECTKPGTPRPGLVTCVTTTVTEETRLVERTVTEFVERTVREDVVTTATEFVERPTTGPCQVGQSDRVGTAEGIATDEVLVTTTKTFEVLLRDEFLVTLEDEILVTTTTVTTEVRRGVGGPLQRGTEKEVDEALQNTEEVGRELVNTDVQREVVGTTFTATGKCKNVSGPQPQARG